VGDGIDLVGTGENRGSGSSLQDRMGKRSVETTRREQNGTRQRIKGNVVGNNRVKDKVVENVVQERMSSK
jgi:hypothetical protein